MREIVAFLLLFTSTASAVWVSPVYNGILDYQSWENPSMSYDSDLTTFTKEIRLQTSVPLGLYYDRGIVADKFRIYASSDIEVWIHYLDGWVCQYMGRTPENEWVVRDVFGDIAEPLYGVKITSTNPYERLEISEFQVNEVPEPVTLLILICGSYFALRKSYPVICDS